VASEKLPVSETSRLRRKLPGMAAHPVESSNCITKPDRAFKDTVSASCEVVKNGVRIPHTVVSEPFKNKPADVGTRD
jgi:hypothetical protein